MLLVHESTDRFKELIGEIQQIYAGGGYKFGIRSNRDNKQDMGHWSAEVLHTSRYFKYDLSALRPIIEQHPQVEEAWTYIQSLIGEKRSLLRVYMNGYTYGADGTLHVDDPWIQEEYGYDTPSETTVVYLNKTWDTGWAGETVILDGVQGDIIKAVLPKHGRALIFDSKLWHGARPVTRACPVLREVLVFKTASTIINDGLIEFLYMNTVNKTFGDDNLFKHLYDTAMVLESRNGTRDICAAGMYHKVYDPAFVGVNSPFTREAVKQAIGEAAENLVYQYSQHDLESLLGDIEIDSKLHIDLLYIHFARLLTEGAYESAVFDRIASKLQQL